MGEGEGAFGVLDLGVLVRVHSSEVWVKCSYQLVGRFSIHGCGVCFGSLYVFLVVQRCDDQANATGHCDL